MDLKTLYTEIINIVKWRSRNILIDPFFILKWDVYPQFKPRNSYIISKLSSLDMAIPVTILTYKRPLYFNRTLQSFIEMNQSNIEKFLLIILVQGERDQETERIIDKYENKIYKVIYPGKNLGCAGGYNLLMAEALKLRLPYMVHLQDDFLSNFPLADYLPEIFEAMEENRDIGCIRLRSIKGKVNDYNVISRRKIKYNKEFERILIGNAHFTFNPTISRSQVIRQLIPTSSEVDIQKKYQRLGLKTGQLLAECFTHIGDERVNDWVK